MPNFFGESKHFIVSDRDVADVEIRVVKAASISGIILIEGPPRSARVPLMRMSAIVESHTGAATPVMLTNINRDGSFSFAGLMPGTLKLHFFPPREGGPLPVRIVRFERDGVKLERDLEIKSGDQISDLNVILGYANSGIHGVVRIDNAAIGSHTVGQVSVSQNGKLVDSVHLDRHGEFVIQNLVAGEYQLSLYVRSGGNGPDLKSEQHVTVFENAMKELTINLSSVR
jgi:hypothetical protein